MSFFTYVGLSAIAIPLVLGVTLIIAAGFVFFEREYGAGWAALFLWAVSSATAAFMLLLAEHCR